MLIYGCEDTVKEGGNLSCWARYGRHDGTARIVRFMDFRKHVKDRCSGMLKVEFICVIWKAFKAHFFFDCVDDGFVEGFRGIFVKVMVRCSFCNWESPSWI